MKVSYGKNCQYPGVFSIASWKRGVVPQGIRFTTITIPQSLTAISHRTWNMGFGWFRHEFLFDQAFLGAFSGAKSSKSSAFLEGFWGSLEVSKNKGKRHNSIQAIMMPSHSRHPSYGHLLSRFMKVSHLKW